MERLTYIKEKKYQSRGRHPSKYSSRHTMQEVINRLAAYEDTGLTPEEAAYFGRLVRGERLVTEEDLMESGVSQEEIQRLKDVITAEAEGRLLVLPCKVGDTVYQTDGVNVYESKVTRLIFDTENYFAFDERSIGKAVFLTREEAEATLNSEGTTRKEQEHNG